MLKKVFSVIVLILVLCLSTEAATYYGQILIKNTPVQGLEVSAEWLDQKGIYHRTSTRTLTKEQAIKKGDAQFEGYYFFEGGSIYPQENTNLVFSFGGFPYNLIVRAMPEQPVVRLNTISFQYVSSYSNQSVKTNQTPENYSFTKEEITSMILSNSTGASLENESKVIIQNISEPITGEQVLSETNNTGKERTETEEKKPYLVKDIFLIFILVIILGLIFGLGYLFIKQGSIYIGNALDEYSSVIQKPKKIAETKVRNITNKLSFVSQKEDISQAISLVSGSGDNCAIVIKEGEYYGYIKEKDLITYPGEYTKNISEVSNLIHKEDITIDSNKRVEEAFLIMEDLGITALIVKEKNKIVGQISAVDLLRAYSSLKFPQSKKEMRDIPLVRDILKKNCPTVNKGISVKEVTEIVSEQNTDLVIIQEERYIGELTTGDLLAGIVKYGQRFKETKAEQIMSSIHSINPDLDIYEACDYILERGFTSYPVIINETLLGVVSPMRLLKELVKDSR